MIRKTDLPNLVAKLCLKVFGPLNRYIVQWLDLRLAVVYSEGSPAAISILRIKKGLGYGKPISYYGPPLINISMPRHGQ